ncbi:MAG: Ig-like domain-containing protein, partial [Planctomycetes bacterium]|nr:Ig-like domain-containing protein [Planctomycetota bacterium]
MSRIFCVGLLGVAALMGCEGAPTVLATDPADGATEVSTVGKILVLFSEPMDRETISRRSIRLVGPSGTVRASVNLAEHDLACYIQPDRPLAVSTTYQIRVAAAVKDKTGVAMGSQFQASFTTGTSTARRRPCGISVTPADGATGVPVLTSVIAIFPINMDAATINSSNLRLYGPEQALIPASVSLGGDNRTATLTPLSPLASNTRYEFKIIAGVRPADMSPSMGDDDDDDEDEDWNEEFSNRIIHRSRFMTGTAMNIPPQVSSVSPSNGATGVPITLSSVTVVFSVPMDPATITDANLTLSSGGTALPSTVSLGSNERTASIVPSVALTPSTTYAVFVSTGVMSISGLPMAASFTSSFATAAPPAIDTTSPMFAGGTSATAASMTSMVVEWDAASDNVDASSEIVYDVYMATSSGGQNFASPTATTGAGALSYTQIGLTAGTTYHFVVRARDTSGNRDSNTVEVFATTLAPPPPPPPPADTTPPMFGGATAATAAGTSSITVAWVAATDNVNTSSQIVYDVYMATSSGGQNFASPTATTGAGALSYT